MNTDVFVSCFAAVSVAFLLDRLLLRWTTDLGSAVILVLLAIVFALVVSRGVDLPWGRRSRRRRA